MVLLFTFISSAATWLYYNFYDYFAFLSGMYVTVIALEGLVNQFDSDSESDTEDVFEEAEEEFRVTAPLAKPEEFNGLVRPPARVEILGEFKLGCVSPKSQQI